MKPCLISLSALMASALTAGAVSPDEAMQSLLQNAPAACRSCDVPPIKYVDPDGKFALGICGQVRAVMEYDFGHVLDDPNNFVSLDIPMTQEPGNGGKFMLSAQQTAFTLNAVALPGTKDEVGIYVTTWLLGDNYLPVIEYALVNYRGFSAGFGYTLFSDTKATIPTIDYMGPCGYTGVGNAGLQYRKKWDNGIGIGAALELPLISYTGTSETTQINQRVPDIPVALSYGWNGGDDWVRLSGVVRNMQYRDLVAAKNRDNLGWGVQLSGSMAMGSPLRLMYQATYGEGIGSYFQDYTDHGYDMIPDPAKPGQLKNVKAWGGYIGVQCNFTDNVYMCAGYSQVRDYMDRYDDGDTPWADQSKYTQFAVGNLFWDITDNMSWGVEYIYGRRANFDGSKASDNRIETMLQFTF